MENFNEYQKKAVSLSISLDRFKKLHPNMPDDVIMLLGIAYDGLGLGEVGEVQGKIKKIIRDNGGVINNEAREAIKGELSDVLWYLASITHNLGYDFSELATHNINKIEDRKKRGVLHGSGDNR